jgi:hypothetical protein
MPRKPKPAAKTPAKPVPAQERVRRAAQVPTIVRARTLSPPSEVAMARQARLNKGKGAE